ncbi:3-hydroxyacyl-ACP dehydratase FabZ [Gammaproteobacteria bacterium]|nr:3-hydroxyacyl-ACP dehydratase FabZ [SAR86 cluster bacterium]MDA7553932.1 3-hydroxyacyl-ACP dehydratase FabZ [Gammaproteobacteria bacterium]MDB3975935.1 3-hydroxyacyl-ACP dehydratase FabZ [Gammaproteobacteria bacterium]MDC0508668.1 3-hydroxyacyl-ACP dehydratase FabZ [Gammaproteobacteria bacterium]MDC0545682.1 3-hydroxyacyl-ACP dehydratase FabZ [Gammaproteobacteria bacterium]|tara:strand:- start:2476 stop:2922 length:447 start_codon:yes stop_codon:yes gene_type:complete
MEVEINIEEIQELLPHRYPILLVDRVTEIVLGDSISAYKNITTNEPFFMGHFPGKQVMPGVLIVEAMAQASGILGFKTMDKKPEDGSIYYFVGADNLRFKRPAVPGDKLILNSKVVTNKKGIWKFDCNAMVESELVAKATILCADRPK